MKKTWVAFFAAVCILLFAGCTLKQAVASKTEVTATVAQDQKYNSATVSLSPEDFASAGFKLGDSCNIVFGNGYTIEDVPFYNGYYVKNGAPVIVAYPGFSNISITYNNMGIWDTANLKEGEQVTITLAEAGKYCAIQEALGQEYSFEREKYASDAEFCNFRALTGGGLKENFFYRGASPVDNSRGRAAYTDKLLEATGIRFVLDLADSEEDMAGYFASDDFQSDYTKELYLNGQDVLLDMSSSFQSEEYRQKVAEGFRQMLNAQGPVYIHCMEGKDRTGFVCMLVEALAGASYEQMRADYMITYGNYFSVSAEETPEKYEAIAELYFDAFVSFLQGTENTEALVKADYTEAAADYLISGGMTEEEVELLKAYITGSDE